MTEYLPHALAPWQTWRPEGDGRYLDMLGPILTRHEGTDTVRCRFTAEHRHANRADNVHGGFLMSCVDEALFFAATVLGRITVGGGVTLRAGVNFIGAATLDDPIDAVTRVAGETGRMIFLTGHLEQAGRTIGTFDGTLRKVRQAG